MVCFSIFEEILSCFTYIYLRVSKIFKKFSLASLKLIWEKEILCSWSSPTFVWAYQKQHMKISSKVIDVQEGYNKKSWRSLDKINLIPCNSFEIWWCDMWVMLMGNYALVRILVLRFVIPYASTKVNSYAMKLHPTCGALFGVSYA